MRHITAGNMSEPLTPLTLFSKHSTLIAEVHADLRGETGFMLFIESLEIYRNRKVLCEVRSVITRVMPASQGGKIITFPQIGLVHDRYIVHTLKNSQLKQHWDHFAQSQLKVADGGAECGGLAGNEAFNRN